MPIINYKLTIKNKNIIKPKKKFNNEKQIK